jgi:hypothetical protein
VTWAEPYAYGVMALDEAQFEAISSTRVFLLMLKGAIRRYELLADLTGHLQVAALMAGGAKFKDGLSPFEQVMGRKPVPIVDPPEIPTEPSETDDERARETAAKLERANAEIFKARMLRDHPERVVGAPIPEEIDGGSG